MLLSIPILITIICLMIELNHQLEIHSPLILKPKEYTKKTLGPNNKYIVWVEISNIHKSMEVMIPFFNVKPQLIGISNDELISIKTKIKPIQSDEEEQENDYWSAYILKSNKSKLVQIEIDYEINNTAIDKFKCLWLDIEWGNYGPFGFLTKFNGFVLPNYSNIYNCNN